MSDTSSFLALRNFAGTLEIAPDAHELKALALAVAIPIAKVEDEAEQAAAVAALRDLKKIRIGIEAARKSVKAPVNALGTQIDHIASAFMADANREEMRLQGLINHFQRKQLDAQRAEEERIRREQVEAQRLSDEAQRKREEAERANDPALKQEAAKLEEKALDAQMSGELAGGTVVIAKPKVLVVRSQLNFQITDAIVFCQAFPEFFTWNAETETLKLKRRQILEELNREDCRGRFHLTHFPEELPEKKDSRIVRPAGMTVFEQTKSHVR